MSESELMGVNWNMSYQWLKDMAAICFKITEAREEDNLKRFYVLLCDLIDRMSFEMGSEKTQELNQILLKAGNMLNAPNNKQGLVLLGVNWRQINDTLSRVYRLYLAELNKCERIFRKNKDVFEEIEEDDF